VLPIGLSEELRTSRVKVNENKCNYDRFIALGVRMFTHQRRE
jgi:hypothetical protein